MNDGGILELEQWRQQPMKIRNYKIFAVDFDGTLSLGKWPDVGPANEELFEFLKSCQKKGDKLILWTCREKECLAAAVKWCKGLGLEFDAVNCNLLEKIDEYGMDSRKVSCDYYIDDRAVSTEQFHDWREYYVRQRAGETNVKFSDS